MRVIIIISSFLNLLLCDGFNLDARLAVIKRGAPESYFGYSVALHRASARYGNWILVGAPLDKNVQPGTIESGAVWRCNISTSLSDCTQLRLDGVDFADENKYQTVDETKELNSPEKNEIKTWQWLGVVVKSGGIQGKILACAHKYMKVEEGKEEKRMFGLCYTISSDMKSIKRWKLCEGQRLTNSEGVAEHIHCQAGTNGYLMDSMVMVGVPGAYGGLGKQFVFNSSQEWGTDSTIYYSNSSIVDGSLSYIGMSMAGAEFPGRPTLYIAGGSRMHKFTLGGVVMFTKTVKTDVLQFASVIYGEQMCSNFGYELAVADVNGDKLPDLIVGAPNYFTNENGGAVYIYHGREDTYFDTKSPSQVLKGPVDSSFGIAITRMGDLNKDGFEDIAVGAPYAEMGKVYIYLGSKSGIQTTPSQVIGGERYKLTTFGSSLSGGMDMDFNEYPDLLVGAYASAAAVLLRSRSILHLDIFNEPPAVSQLNLTALGCSADPKASLTCFSFKSCIKPKSAVKDIAEVKLHYTMEADRGNNVRRARFMKNGNLDYLATGEVTIYQTDQPELSCEEHIIYIQQSTKYLRYPLIITLNYTMMERKVEIPKPGDPLPSMSLNPAFQPQIRQLEVSFLQDCAGEVCMSRLVLQAWFNLEKVSAATFNEWLLPVTQEEIILTVDIKNEGENAYNTILQIVHTEKIKFISTIKKSKSGLSNCEKMGASILECKIADPLGPKESRKMGFKFGTKGIEQDVSKILTMIVSATTASQNDISESEKYLRITPKHDITPPSIIGDSSPQQITFDHTKTDEVVNIIFNITSQYKFIISEYELHIDLPENVFGKHEIYKNISTTMSGNSKDGVCVRADGTKLTIKYDEEEFLSTVTSNTDEKYIQSAGTSSAMEKVKQKILDCNEFGVICERLICKMKHLRPDETDSIRITAEIPNSLMDYFIKTENINSLKIYTKAMVYVPVSAMVLEPLQSKSVNVILEVISITKKPDNIWIYLILAVMLGILVLMLVILCLYKRGFFIRNRPENIKNMEQKQKLIDNKGTGRSK